MRAVLALVLTVCSTWIFGQPAFAEKRVALVMGNSAYLNVNRLANPANDSSAISDTLKSAGARPGRLPCEWRPTRSQ